MEGKEREGGEGRGECRNGEGKNERERRGKGEGSVEGKEGWKPNYKCLI